MSEDVTDREKELLEKVPVLAPPAGFAARVMAMKSRRVFRTRVMIGAAAVLVIGLFASAPRSRAFDGQLIAQEERSSLQIGVRGVAVAEGGSALVWAVAANGAAAVQQSSGNVFYRVEPGGAFVVSTSAGEVRVTGTCFRVEVSDVKTSSIASAAGGALVATLMTVTVYEGRVMASAPGQPAMALAAGEAATIDGKTVAKRAPFALPAPSLAARTLAERAPVKPRAALPENLDPAALYAAHAELAKEADALRAQVDTLNSELKKAKKKEEPTLLEISPEELQEMASQCRLRWDTISLDHPSMPVAAAEKAELSEEERAAIDKKMAAHQKLIVDQIRALYVETTGDPNAGSMAAEAMQVEIVDKAPPGEVKRTFQRLARERAGLPVPPLAPGQAELPVTRLYRALTTSGDMLEASIAEELGPETAHRARKAREGWGSQHGSSYGCPSE